MQAIEHTGKCNCACDSCMDEDCQAIVQAHPHSTWTRQRLEWIRGLRQRPLNWTLPEGHCALCGGTDLSAWNQSEHWFVRNHNPKEVNGIWYMSLLIADGAGLYATYVLLSRKGKLALQEWTSHLLRMSPRFACAVAVRRLENWTEIRVGFKEPVKEIDLMKALTQSLVSQQT